MGENQTVTFYRRLPKFDYVKPESMDEVLKLIVKGSSGKFQIYAGGTDVIPRLKRREADKPEILIDLKGIPDLDYVDYDEKAGLRIGALATIRSVATSSIVGKGYSQYGVELYDFEKGLGNSGTSYSFTSHLTEVDVDLETGFVKCTDMVIAHDCGKPLSYQCRGPERRRRHPGAGTGHVRKVRHGSG